MKIKKIPLSLVVILLISVLLVACSSASKNFPTGKFSIAESDGNATFEFNRDGTFVYSTGGVSAIRGTYKVDDDVYTELSNTGHSGNPACSADAQYYWDFNGTALTFSTLDDSCLERQALYTTSAMIK